jgi:D-psicose/D-tagatose/L-ribulose 3-epimerase
MSALRYAVHAYAWTPSWSNATLDIIDRAKRLGFDLIEIPLMEVEKVDPPAIRKRLEAVGLRVCTSTACSERNDLTGDDESTRRRGVEYLTRCVQATAEMGAKCFTGVTYSAIGQRIDGFPDERHWQRAAEGLRQVARRAASVGITVGIEPINRYETFLVNTCDQALRLREMIGEPNVAVHLDAYHMNIEENNFHEPTRKAAPHLCHFHLSESHRGTPGTGTVDWDGIFRALAESGYRGTVGMESFCETSDAMRAATCVWRKLAPSSDELLRNGLEFLKAVEAKYYGPAAKKGN